jgi:ABC-type uncharacterized transport system substrate-binding protein
MKKKVIGLALGALLFALSVSTATAQQTGKVFRIGFLNSSTASGTAVLLEPFRQELSKLGWIEGKNFIIEYRFGENKGSERLPEFAADLVRLKVDLILVADTPSSLAAKRVTTTIPIVMVAVGDPVAAGLVESLAQPGGNVTGFSSLSFQLATKRLEILKDAVPKLVRVGLLKPAGGSNRSLKELGPAALALKLKLEEIETQRDPKDLERAFQSAKQKQVSAMMTTPATAFFAERKRIVQIPLAGYLPTEGVCR